MGRSCVARAHLAERKHVTHSSAPIHLHVMNATATIPWAADGRGRREGGREAAYFMGKRQNCFPPLRPQLTVSAPTECHTRTHTQLSASDPETQEERKVGTPPRSRARRFKLKPIAMLAVTLKLERRQKPTPGPVCRGLLSLPRAATITGA